MPPEIDQLGANILSDLDQHRPQPQMDQKRPIQTASQTKWSAEIRQYNLTLTRLWRRYGVKLSFFFTFYLIWSGFESIIIDQDPISEGKSYSGFQTFWLAAHRTVTLFIVNFTLPGIVSLLLYTLPGEGYDDIDEDEDRANNNTIRQHPLKIILRIVTRGDYPKLIQDNIDYHENLFKSYWRNQNDQIEIHIASERPLNLARPRKNGMEHRCEVKEFDIPTTYTTPNKTLYKVRMAISGGEDHRVRSNLHLVCMFHCRTA